MHVRRDLNILLFVRGLEMSTLRCCQCVAWGDGCDCSWALLLKHEAWTTTISKYLKGVKWLFRDGKRVYLSGVVFLDVP